MKNKITINTIKNFSETFSKFGIIINLQKRYLKKTAILQSQRKMYLIFKNARF